jgi:predicted N-acetyltransferase YhbS
MPDNLLDAGTLDTDDVHVRTLRSDDLEAIIRIDTQHTGIARRAFYAARLERSLGDSSVHLSVVAEADDHVVGFAMVSFFQGEFGRPEPSAVLDAIGVHPEYAGKHVGRAMLRQLTTNLRALHVETLRTELDWDDFQLLAFFAQSGFKPASRVCLERRVDHGE